MGKIRQLINILGRGSVVALPGALLFSVAVQAASLSCSNVFESAQESDVRVWLTPWLGYFQLREGNSTAPFINLPLGKKTNLKSRFAYIFDERYAHFILTPDRPKVESADLKLHVYRDMPEGFGELPLVTTPIRATDILPAADISSAKLEGLHKKMMDELYQSYSEQGVEVSSGVPHYQTQDREKTHRVTHFIFSFGNEKALAHTQVLQKSDVKLNLEDEFNVEVTGGKKIFEIGRTRILRNEKTQKICESLTGDPNHRTFFQLLLYRKLFAWLNSDVRADAAVMHVNAAMRRVIQSPHSPLQLSEIFPVTAGNMPSEYVAVMDRAELLRSEENILRELLRIQIKHALQSTEPTLVLTFRANERAALQRIIKLPPTTEIADPGKSLFLWLDKEKLLDLQRLLN